MLVNAFVLWDANSKKAWVFDTGPMAEPILDLLRMQELYGGCIFLTHTHRDHIACLDELRRRLAILPFMCTN